MKDQELQKQKYSEENMTSNLSTDMLQTLRIAFEKLDTDSDGQLSLNEFREVFRLADEELTNEQTNIYFKSLEPNSRNCIDFDRFIELFTKGEQCLSPRCVVKNLFAEFDSDQDGFITYEEFKSIANTFNHIPYTDVQIYKAFNRYDSDDNGLICTEEMEQAMENIFN